MASPFSALCRKSRGREPSLPGIIRNEWAWDGSHQEQQLFMPTVKNFQLAVLAAVMTIASGFSAAARADAEARSALLQGYRTARAAGAAEIQGPIFLRSSEGGDALQGDAYAVIEHPFAQVESVLKDPGNWCDVLVLHLNVKHCRAADAQLVLYLGQKVPQSLEESYRVAFAFRTNAVAADYM